MHLNAKSLNVVGTVRTTSEVRKVELNLVPALIQAHRHCANEGLHTGGRLVVGGTEAAAETLVIENLNFEGEVLLEVLDDHDEEGELNTESLLGISGAGDVAGVDVAADEFEDGGVNVLICEALNVTVADFLFPNLKGTGADGVEDRQEA